MVSRWDPRAAGEHDASGEASQRKAREGGGWQLYLRRLLHQSGALQWVDTITSRADGQTFRLPKRTTCTTSSAPALILRIMLGAP